MNHVPAPHHRRSIRLAAYDYAQPGAYFFTVVAYQRQCLFGDIVDGEVMVNACGEALRQEWARSAEIRREIQLDAFVVMPNHIHGIIVFVGAGPRACPDSGRPQGVAPTISLPDVVHRFKSLTTARYRTGVLQDGWRPFLDRLWQRNYYEHIIRHEEELNHVRQYIIDNPARWQEDPENPACQQQPAAPDPGHQRPASS